MQPASNLLKRPALRYYGGGWTRAKWTLGFIPKSHNTWVDLCVGAGSISVLKDPVPMEIVNDKDDRTVNFLRQLRDNENRLIELIHLTPWAEAEMRYCLNVSSDPLEDARRFFAMCWMTVHGGPNGDRASFRYQKSIDGRFTPPAFDVINRNDLFVFSARIKSWHIFSRDAIELIKKYGDNPDAALYFDPPYLQEKRARKQGYTHEVSPGWHRLAAYWLRQTKGYVVVAGYRSRLYERIYEAYGWQRVEREQKTNGKTTATECLWLSPNTQAALRREAAPLLEPCELPIFPNGLPDNGWPYKEGIHYTRKRK